MGKLGRHSMIAAALPVVMELPLNDSATSNELRPQHKGTYFYKETEVPTKNDPTHNHPTSRRRLLQALALAAAQSTLACNQPEQRTQILD